MELRCRRAALVGPRRVSRASRSGQLAIGALACSRRGRGDGGARDHIGLDCSAGQRELRDHPARGGGPGPLAAGAVRFPRRGRSPASRGRVTQRHGPGHDRLPDLPAARRTAKPSGCEGESRRRRPRLRLRERHARVFQAPPRQALPLQRRPARVPRLPDRERRDALLWRSVGEHASLPAVVREAVGFAEAHGLKLAALGVGGELVPLWEQAGLRAFYIGDEAVVETSKFSLEGRPIRKVRQSVSRLEKAGYRAELQEVGTLDEPTLAELEAVSARWRRGLRSAGSRWRWTRCGRTRVARASSWSHGTTVV